MWSEPLSKISGRGTPHHIDTHPCFFLFQGYNSTLFAYGQTGSGKTYTMEGYQYYLNNKGVPVADI